MNREIKYMVWNATSKTMHSGMFYIKQNTGKCHYWELNGGFYDCGTDEIVLLQYTGKNAKSDNAQVYEGHICTATFLNSTSEYLHLTGSIFMDDYMWCLKADQSHNGDNVFSLNRIEIIEVIGNIYQNPELIKTA